MRNTVSQSAVSQFGESVRFGYFEPPIGDYQLGYFKPGYTQGSLDRYETIQEWGPSHYTKRAVFREGVRCRRNPSPLVGPYSKLLFIVSIMVSIFLCPVEAVDVDTYDVHVQLYNDPSCILGNTAFIMTTENCYAAQVYNPNSAVTRAFDVEVVRYQIVPKPGVGNVGSLPRAINLRQYTDDCKTVTPGSSVMQAPENACRPFIGEGQSAMYAQYTLRHRSKYCEKDCSQLQVVRQDFWDTTNCAGSPFKQYYYPVGDGMSSAAGSSSSVASSTAPAQKGACLTYYGGSQDFQISKGKFVIESDYENNQRCSGPAKPYNVTLDACYAIHMQKSFKYTLVVVEVASGAWRMISGSSFVGLLYVGALAVLYSYL